MVSSKLGKEIHRGVFRLSLHLSSSGSRKTLEQIFQIFQIGTLNPYSINDRLNKGKVVRVNISKK